ncbi:hypothetical protein [Streptomyces lydicus]|uniref:hypothetical protein n=1 Tax=Streptomyces lydicus TaxID=47763 RepID=UPI0037B3283A
MNQVELLDANGYIVPTATQYAVPRNRIAEVENHLLTELAVKDAAEQSRDGCRVYASEYRTRVVPMAGTARLAQAA